MPACQVTQLHPTLCDPMDCSPPGSFVHGILQAGILEWVAVILRVHISKWLDRASLVVQWLRIQLPMQGTWVWRLVQEDPTCYRTTKPMRSYWAQMPQSPWSAAREATTMRSWHVPTKTQCSQNVTKFFKKRNLKWVLFVLWESWKVSDTSMPHQMIDRYTNTAREGDREFGIYLGSAISPQAIYFKEKVWLYV